MDRTVQQQPKAQEPMTADAPKKNSEGAGSKQVTFGYEPLFIHGLIHPHANTINSTTRYTFYPSPGTSTSAQAGSISSIKQPSITTTEAVTEPSQTHQPPQSGPESQSGQNASGLKDGQDPSCIRGGATGNCCTEPFGCCIHWAKNICGNGHN